MSLPRPDSAAQPSGDARALFASVNAAAGCQTAPVPPAPPALSDAERASPGVLPRWWPRAGLPDSPVKPVPANWSGRRAQPPPEEPLTCNSQPGNWLLEGS